MLIIENLGKAEKHKKEKNFSWLYNQGYIVDFIYHLNLLKMYLYLCLFRNIISIYTYV